MGLKKRLGYLGRGILGFLQNNAEGYPKIPATLQNNQIGISTQRRPIRVVRVGDGPRKILYCAGLHGNEVGTIKLAHRLISWLCGQKKFLEKFTFFVIPCLNPDGFALAQKKPGYLTGGRLGRLNGREVDLNRNFDTASFKQKSAWTFGKNYSERSEVYCGEHGGSEPETRALTEFIKKHDVEVLFMFHSCGCDVMGNKNELSQKLTRLYAEHSGFKYIDDEEWVALKQTGTAKEWCEENGIAFIEIEGSTRWGSDWGRQKTAIEKTLEVF